MTADLLVTPDPVDQGLEGQLAAIVIKGIHTTYFDCYPTASKSAHDVQAAILDFCGSREMIDMDIAAIKVSIRTKVLPQSPCVV